MRGLRIALLLTGALALVGCGGEAEQAADVDAEMSAEFDTEMADDTIDMGDEPDMGEDLSAGTIDDAEAQIESDGTPDEDLRVITDLDDEVKLILTEKNLLMLLTRNATERRRQQLTARGFADDLKDAVKEGVKEVVREEAKKLELKLAEETGPRLRIVYPLEEVLGVRYGDAGIEIDLANEKRLSFDDILSNDGRPVLQNFPDEDARRFALTFERLRL